ncbi:class I SAM-dependent methyltransferase [Dyella tabacisoli]|uniref:Methyltransferase domain-containing protein n=1 Tax=Dyella tabacisoli TaxID=2282381 RepID=A0A369UUZ0_9GAMM|nr:class I SAM-dependent methyltransferase [Dyella tabacisoli]RDD82169.1 methyltransferase domain-containing protein [Dyella tabacisoli]
MSAASAPPWTAFDLVEGLQLSHALTTLHDLGVLAALAKPRSTEDLATEFGLDSTLLGNVLEFAVARTDLLAKRGRRYIVTASYDASARFVLDLYAGAFLGNAIALPSLLRQPRRSGDAVDRIRHARAFLHPPSGPELAPAALLHQLGIHAVLDLGCGPATLLRHMALNDPEFRGWGIDANPAMCRMARARLRETGVLPRVRIMRGDGRDPLRTLSVQASSQVEAIVAGDLVNELFAKGSSAAEAWLSHMRRQFPQRLLLIIDYYGRLGHGYRDAGRETLLHDYVQAISGQGVPPPNQRAWRAMYRAAGAKLIHCIEDKRTTRFLHLLLLKAPA